MSTQRKNYNIYNISITIKDVKILFSDRKSLSNVLDWNSIFNIFNNAIPVFDVITEIKFAALIILIIYFFKAVHQYKSHQIKSIQWNYYGTYTYTYTHTIYQNDNTGRKRMLWRWFIIRFADFNLWTKFWRIKTLKSFRYFKDDSFFVNHFVRYQYTAHTM